MHAFKAQSDYNILIHQKRWTGRKWYVGTCISLFTAVQEKNKRKWDKVKLTQGNTSCIRGLENWDRHAIWHNEKGMGWSTLDLGISPRRRDAIIYYFEKEKKKKREKKEENERKALRKRIVFVFIFLSLHISVEFSISGTKTYRLRIRVHVDDLVTVPIEYDTHEEIE